MLKYSKQVRKIVLASGDRDYTEVVEEVIKKHRATVEVYGVPGLTAVSLIRSATRYIPIEGDLLLPRQKSDEINRHSVA